MLYVAPFIMKNLLSDEAYNHILLYIIAYRLLSDVELYKDNTDIAETYLKIFFQQVPN